MGDEIQAFKAGLMEIGDIIVVNKADLPGANRTLLDIRGMLQPTALNEHGSLK